jgi:hypothetical protein
MVQSRHERERPAWVLSRAGRRPGARRRGEKLAAKARRFDRELAGAGDAAFNEITTRNIFYRNVMREEGAANVVGWFVLTTGWMFWTAALVGPALVLGAALYGLAWALVPRLGRVKVWPFLVLALVALTTSVVLWIYWPPSSWAPSLLFIWTALQMTCGPLRAAQLTRANTAIAPIEVAIEEEPEQEAAPPEPVTVDIEVDDSEGYQFFVDTDVVDDTTDTDPKGAHP